MKVQANETHTGTQTMICMRGQGVVKGYAIGRAVVMGAAALEVAHYRIQPAEVASECQSLREAMAAARDDLQNMVATLPEHAPSEIAALLTVHSMLLEDPMLTQQTSTLIGERLYNAEWA